MQEGIIEITKIENTPGPTHESNALCAKFVRYPESQQLTVWLPTSGYQYPGDYILEVNKQIIEKDPVQHKLNGSVMLLFDTMDWNKGEYILSIEMPQGGQHKMYFIKHAENELVDKNQVVEMQVAKAGQPSLWKKEPVIPMNEMDQKDTLWKEYRDGSGNVIPNADQALRNKALRDIEDTMNKAFSTLHNPRLEYEGNFRSGNIYYIEGDTRIGFDHEMGGGNCKMYINIPSPDNWESSTGVPVDRRDGIIRFVANQVKRDQAPSWRYEIDETSIAYY